MENNNDKAGSEGANPNDNHHNDDVQGCEENPNLLNVEEQQQRQDRQEDVVEEEEEEEDGAGSDVEQPPQLARQTPRTPFTNLSQVDFDLVLARTLHEQERAYMMLRMNNDGSDYGSWEAGSYVHDDEDDFADPHDDSDRDDDDEEEEGEERYDGANIDIDEDAFDVYAHNEAGEDTNPSIEFDPAVFSSDEAYARALQNAEDREMAARLLALAGINDVIGGEVEDIEDHGGNSQDTWEELDPDELSYEELIALGEVVGTEGRGLSADKIASLPSVNYKSGSCENGSNDSCVICWLDYEDGETLILLSCKHSYHPECINNWLKINKVCPVCCTEVSVSGNSL